VHELGRSPPVDSNELFDIATIFASREEAVGAIFDGKKSKNAKDAPAEGSNPRIPQRSRSGARRARSPNVMRACRDAARTTTRPSQSTLHARVFEPPSRPRRVRRHLKKPCLYHKTLVNHTLEQCDMLKKYYSRVTVKEDEAKKDGGDGDADNFPIVENVFLIFGEPMVDMSTSQCKHERHKALAAEKAPPSFLP
jgi:hypothetical protein